MSTAAAAMIVAPMAVMAVMTIPPVAPVMIVMVVVALAAADIDVDTVAVETAIIVPDGMRARRLCAVVITRRAFVINHPRRHDHAVVVMNYVIDIADVLADIVAQSFADDHPAAVRLKARRAIRLLRTVADINSARVFPALLTAAVSRRILRTAQQRRRRKTDACNDCSQFLKHGLVLRMLVPHR